LVPDAVLAAMAIPQQPGRPALDSVLGALRTRQLLLVLDNCEHLLDACAALAEAALRNCADVRILATSREPLRVAGETRWRVPSLSLPTVNEVASLEPAAACEAVQLFLERARTSCLTSSWSEATDAGQDVVGGFDAHEWLGISIVAPTEDARSFPARRPCSARVL
jgi:predicted ATPase